MNRRPLPLYAGSALLMLLAVVFGVESVSPGLWQDGMPGPGLVPGIGAALLAGLLVLLVWRGRGVPDEQFGFSAQPFLALDLLLAYALALPHGGFVPTSLVMIILGVRLFHRQRWARASLLAMVLIAVCVLLFKVALRVPLLLFPALP